MSRMVQVVVDCVDPHTLADWWAETLGWVVEVTDEELIRRLIAEGQAAEEDTTVHHGRLVWKAGAAICPPEQLGNARRLRYLFQPVPEPRQGKNRVHWDVRLEGEDRDAVRQDLEARGATYLDWQAQGPYSWHVMADPEGNEFCLT